MLTGDRLVVAQAIAQQAGVDDPGAGPLPDDKVTVAEEPLERHGRVGMATASTTHRLRARQLASRWCGRH